MDKITESYIGEVEAVKDEPNYVIVPMVMFAYESSKYVTEDEIVYYEIVYHASARDVSMSHVNVELLYARLKWDASTPSRGKKRIIDSIVALKEKGYIVIESHGEEITAATYLTIRINKRVFKDRIVCGNTAYTGWTKIYESEMNTAKTDRYKIGQRLKVLTYIKWRHNINYSICFEEWANVLGASPRTAKRIIKSLKEEGVINVKSGEYYTDWNNNVRQEINQFSLPEEKEELDDDYKPTVTQRQRKMVSVAELLTKTTDKRMVDRPELFVYGDLSEEDMYIYLTTECSIVKEWGKKRFDAISKKPKGKEMVENWEMKAKKRIENEQQEPRRIQIEAVQKENPTTVSVDVTNYTEQDEDAHTKAYRMAQAKREEQERIKREEENERFRQEMLELEDEYEEAI
ncbi:hypothetical protein [Brevibacillus borstelensis]|uniref:hypothetical protein n=1 Tax=Brevibacillus borstelensis TaxID=45462 RepID=UPI00046A6200|nr:hypothetical protein [Brevibacillus borstelensis]